MIEKDRANLVIALSTIGFSYYAEVSTLVNLTNGDRVVIPFLGVKYVFHQGRASFSVTNWNTSSRSLKRT